MQEGEVSRLLDARSMLKGDPSLHYALWLNRFRHDPIGLKTKLDYTQSDWDPLGLAPLHLDPLGLRQMPPFGTLFYAEFAGKYDTAFSLQLPYGSLFYTLPL